MGDRLEECRIIEIPLFKDVRGSLLVIEGAPSLPFDFKRFYCIFGVAEGARRGGHAHKIEKTFVIALAGSFSIVLSDGDATRDLRLDRPDRGLYVPPLVWHEMHSFAADSMCLVAASECYNPEDYYPSYQAFLRAVGGPSFESTGS